MAPLNAVLFDLDDTLFDNDIHTFLPPYFALISEYARPYLESGRFLEELLICTRVMVASDGGNELLRDLFWSCFEKRTGLDPAELEPHFDRFYRHEFDQLAKLTGERAEAQRLVSLCVERDMKLVVATNPLFPRVAIERRLAWAGLPTDKYGYDLVTSYDNMHAAKPKLAYYAEILDTINCSPEQSLMVGDSWENDIMPAAKSGMATYWVSQGADPADHTLLSGSGTLQELHQLLLSSWFDEIPLPATCQLA